MARPLPNPLDNVLKTGTIGGGTKQPEPVQETTHTATQQTTYVGGDEKVQQTMKIKRSLAMRVKVYVATHPPTTISSIVELALEEYLAKHENR